jgi:hypothetical protein
MSTHPTAPVTRALTFEATFDEGPEALLLHLALGLYEQRLKPRTLTWTAARGHGKIKVDLILAVDAEGYERLTEFLKAAPGVRHVAPLDYDIAVQHLSGTEPDAGSRPGVAAAVE